jgi:hypothetical protein
MKNNTMRIFFALLCSFLLACHPAHTLSNKNINQGISGYVQEVSGNRMPSPDAPPASPRGIRTTVYIYEPTNTGQVDRIGTSAFYHSIRTKLIRSVKTDASGYFAIALPAGSYSLFTRIDGKFYANNFDQMNNIALTTVVPDMVSLVKITVNSKAVY